MAKPIQHYEYLAQERIGSLYQQIHKNRLLGIPIQASFTLPFFGFTIGKPAEKEPSLPEQLHAVFGVKSSMDTVGKCVSSGS